MRRLIPFLLVAFVAACGGPHTPEAPKAETTQGFTFQPVTQDLSEAAVSGVTYTAYCHSEGTDTVIVKPLGVETVVYWSAIPFPWDGNWYCGVTAKTSDFSESPLSSLLGVKKEGNIYYRL